MKKWKKLMILLVVLLAVLLLAAPLIVKLLFTLFPRDPGPPTLVKFDSPEMIQEYIQAANLPDDEFEIYEREFRKRQMCSPTTKEEAQRFAKMMESVGLPVYAHPEKTETCSYLYYADRNRLEVTYTIHGVRYRFSYSEFEEYTDWRFKWVRATYTIDGREIPVYKTGGRLTSELYAGGYRIRIIVMDSAKPKELALSDFTWSREMEYMDQ